MNSRVLYLGAAVALALVAMVALLAAALTGWAVVNVVAAPDGAQQSQPDGAQLVSRAISIPFGIDASLPVIQDGNAVLASGHGTCPEGGQTFDLRVDVVQAATGARAMGRTAGDCMGGMPLTWEATAVTPPPFTFDAGPAEACAMVQVFFDRTGTIVHKWCVDVTLEK